MTAEQVAERAIAHFHAAAPQTREAGRLWYTRSRRDVRAIASLLPPGVGQSAAAAILAALSPQTQWVQNWLWAERIAAAAGRGDRRRPRVGGFPNNRAKAWRIANGENPDHVLGGLKVRAFWRALYGDPDAVVLDLWMFRAFGLPDAPPASVYRTCAEGMRIAAAELGVAARDLQATIWLHVRGSKPSDPDHYLRAA